MHVVRKTLANVYSARTFAKSMIAAGEGFDSSGRELFRFLSCEAMGRWSKASEYSIRTKKLLRESYLAYWTIESVVLDHCSTVFQMVLVMT